MYKFIRRFLVLISVSCIIYLSIALTLIYFGVPESNVEINQVNADSRKGTNNLTLTPGGINFSEMIYDYRMIPELQKYIARDGTALSYRYYPSESNQFLILLHGSAWHSQQFFQLAEYISGQGLAQVYTPDLRGHGVNPKRRGDIDYIGQLEDDIADLIDIIIQDSPNTDIILGGHSSGGGLAIRFAGSKYGTLVNAYMLLAPFIYYNAPTTRPNAGGWAKPFTSRIIGLSMLNNIGIHWFNGLTSIKFNMPMEFRNGTETLSYSFRLNTSYAPRNYKADLSAIEQPLIVIAGTDDETMFSEKYKELISDFTQVQVELLKGVSHMGVVVGAENRSVIKQWLQMQK